MVHTIWILLIMIVLLIACSGRDFISKRIKDISFKKVPKIEDIRAMCYDMAEPEPFIEYICPLDGEKSIYARNTKAYGYAKSVDQYKREIVNLNALSKDKGTEFLLDESLLCSHHALDAKDRYLILIAKNIKTGKETRTNEISYLDLKMLIAFFGDELFYESYNNKKPLKPKLPRIKEMLGV